MLHKSISAVLTVAVFASLTACTSPEKARTPAAYGDFKPLDFSDTVIYAGTQEASGTQPCYVAIHGIDMRGSRTSIYGISAQGFSDSGRGFQPEDSLWQAVIHADDQEPKGKQDSVVRSPKMWISRMDGTTTNKFERDWLIKTGTPSASPKGYTLFGTFGDYTPPVVKTQDKFWVEFTPDVQNMEQISIIERVAGKVLPISARKFTCGKLHPMSKADASNFLRERMKDVLANDRVKNGGHGQSEEALTNKVESYIQHHLSDRGPAN